jgi:AraC-like DNA-binding protein
MGYREFAAPRSVTSHVACLWVSAGAGVGQVLPDGCVDLVWTGQRLVVAGPSTRVFTTSGTTSAPRVGLRFRTGAAAAVLRHPMHELRDASPDLADVWTGAGTFDERIADVGSPRAQLRLLTAMVSGRLVETVPVDPVVRAAVVALAHPRPRPPRGDVLSERQLRRRFLTHVGYPPQTLARVLRLQRLLRLACSPHASSADTGLAELALRAGFADQSHLGRETRRLTGITPATLLATSATPAGEPDLGDQPRPTPPSADTDHDGLWAISHGFPSRSMMIES